MASTHFQIFRITLLPHRQFELFGEKAAPREEWIRKTFGEPFAFIHQGNEFHFVPTQLEGMHGVIGGRIGRAILRQENRPPEEEFEETMHQGWIAAPVLIDPTDHADGQKLSMQIKNEVGSPIAIARSLSNYLSGPAESPYLWEINPIIEAKSFWAFAREHKGRIVYVRFEFVAPNIFGTSDAMKKDMETYRDEEKAQRVALELRNAEGLEVETERVKQAVDYAAQRGGGVKARSMDGENYSSSRSFKKIRIIIEEDQDLSLPGKLISIAKRIFKDE